MGRSKEDDLEKQIGCMAGFLHIFDRPQILSAKRLYATKRLPRSLDVESATKSETSSPLRSRELEKHKQRSRWLPSTDRSKQSTTLELKSPIPEPATPVAEDQTRPPLILPILELKEGTSSPWKFSREAPRLSLDSRAVMDAKGSLKPRHIRANAVVMPACNTNHRNDDAKKQHRSPSVIARLMGLELTRIQDPEQAEKAELRRSASESRVNREYRFIDCFNIQSRNLESSVASNVIKGEKSNYSVRNRSGFKDDYGGVDPMDFPEYGTQSKPVRASLPPHRAALRREKFFDSTDFIPRPKQTVAIYGEIDKKLEMRGIDKHANDLESLKQLHEALQLKGLLHSNQLNFVRERSYAGHESRIKPARSPVQRPRPRDASPSFFRSGGQPHPAGRGSSPSLSPRAGRVVVDLNNARNRTRGGTKTEGSIRIPTTSTALNEAAEHRRMYPVQSSKVGLSGPGQIQKTNRSPMDRPRVYRKEDQVSVSESSIGTCSRNHKERWQVEEHNKEGRNILERCDKLLQSIAEMTGTVPTESQPSPVSVLDSSLYNEESSPSPVMKRSLNFIEDEMWGSTISLTESKPEDCDFMYISEILRASDYLPEDSDIFLLLEKQQYLKGKCTSKVSRLERRLIFDAIQEILNQKRLLPPWNTNTRQTSLQKIWSEFQKIRERKASVEEMFEVMICDVPRTDLSEDDINGWDDRPVEICEAVLEIERLIFKDLICETIWDLLALVKKITQVGTAS